MIKKLAKELRAKLILKKRTNGDSYICFTENVPEWMHQAARHVHGDMLPDDYKYLFFRDALDCLIESDGALNGAIDELETHIYNKDLINWLSSRLDRAEHVDLAVECGLVSFKPFNLFDAIRAGEMIERKDVLEKTHAFLQRAGDRTYNELNL